MTLVELATMVREMQRWQARYFKDRSQASLEASKEQEKRVRNAVAEVLDPPILPFGDSA